MTDNKMHEKLKKGRKENLGWTKTGQKAVGLVKLAW